MEDCKHKATQWEHGLLWLESGKEELRCLDCGEIIQIVKVA